MSETNKSLRIRTTINDTNPSLYVNLDQTYNTFEILSLKLSQEDVYKLHSANYGVIVGRVLANGNFGVPNAKISIFIEGNFENEEISAIYPYTSTSSQDKNGVRYNLLPDEKVDDCHQVVGTFPNKTYVLDNDVLIEVFDKYYKYTTRTNNSGDYIIAGVPTGSQTLHMDLDLSDCGILSQRPRDFVYKGYTIEQFENANQFKKDTNLESLSQIFSQDQVVNVIPFWGNENQGETIGITRADINISFRFEPTCVFMGSVVADNSSNGISKKCVPTNQMGAMDELTTGEGTIEMIRYTPGGDIEEFQIKGTQLIDGNGVWCYQIPMNLDYMMTDEYGNMVPTDDPDKGIPTRTRVRFRVSMHDMEKNTDNYFRAKVLVPHNPQMMENGEYEDYDYEFGSNTKEDSFRDLLWNNVYTVKSYIPRFQKSKTAKETARFTGIKHCNYYGNNNPMPYNNIRIKLPLMFMILCALIKTYIRVVDFVNQMITAVGKVLGWLSKIGILHAEVRAGFGDRLKSVIYIVLADGLCPDLENWYFSPNKSGNYVDANHDSAHEFLIWDKWAERDWNFLQQTFDSIVSVDSAVDENSIDEQNATAYQNSVCLTTNVDYLVSCIEMALAQEYKVINFDFYNDWVNGVIYMPRWMRFIRPKRKFLFGLITIKSKVKACMDDTSIFNKTRNYVQQCALTYGYNSDTKTYTKVVTPRGCAGNTKKQKCHKGNGKALYAIFGGSKSYQQKGNGGIVHENETMKGQYVYYLKPCEWRLGNGKKINLFANDIVLLGSLLDCNLYGIPQAYKYLTSSSYIMPTNLALTNMDDEGYLYADDNGTICSNRVEKTEGLKEVKNDFEGIQKYWSTSSDNFVYGQIEGDNFAEVYDDSIPMTEAAGIAWNYTGPGQGEKSNNIKESLYMPGGHFLGISCINSETNIKSCINLERICEVGSNMSQRREEIRKIDKDDNSLLYRYFVPTGLIANDEINGGTFRNMFATMNQTKLLCKNKFDEKTGYPIYDFVYLRPNGFDGGLKDEVTDDRWNRKVSNVEDEKDTSAFVNLSIDTEYDTLETANTYTRTIEETKADYYKFRLGITNLTSRENQKKKFLLEDGDSVKLPQYENSFYFYFGLRDGATAFDEFNKQFFSVCDSSNIIKKNFNIEIISEENINECKFAEDVTFQITEANGIVSGYIEFDDETDCTKKRVNVNYQTENGSLQFTDKLMFGVYTFNLTDENGSNVVKTFEIGKGQIEGSFSTKPFEFRTTGLGQSDVLVSARTLDCGYISVDSLEYFGREYGYTGLTWNDVKNNLVILKTSSNGKQHYGNKFNKLPSCITTGYGESMPCDTSVVGKIYVSEADATYDIYLTSLSTGDTCAGYAFLGSVYVEGIDNYDLYLGSKLLPYSTKLKDLSGEWWFNIGGNNIEDWAKRYALFKRTDNSASTFTNKIIAINSQSRILDTALFGQPENPDSEHPSLLNNVYYENDNFPSTYSLSDMSVIPTTLSVTRDAVRRELFGEMAINGSAVISDKLGTYTVSFVSESPRNHFTIDSGEISNKIKEGHGCIAKLSDGTLLYPVRYGNIFYFDDNIPETETGRGTLSLYPIFYYPVMYRPFYVNASIAVWCNKSYKENFDSDGTTTYTVGYNSDKYKTALSIKNGLTYKEYFEHVNFNGVEIDAKVDYDDISGLDSGYTYTDRSKDRITLKTPTNESGTTDEKFSNFSYDVKENGPSSGETGYDKLVDPNPITLTSISDSISNDSADEIFWRVRESGNAYIVSQFTNNTGDVSSSEKQYYLVNGGISSRLPKPLIKRNKAYISININQSSDKLYLFKFTIYSDSHLNVLNTGQTYVNVPGSLIDVTITEDNVASFAYISSNVDGRVLRKTITGSDLDDVIRKLTDTSDSGECCLEPVLYYEWNGVDYPDTVDSAGCETFINGLNDLTEANKKIIFSGESTYVISEEFKENAYVVSVKKNVIGENGSTVLVKVYPEITEIIDYSGEGEDTYFIWSDGSTAITSNISYEGIILTSGYSTNYENLTFTSNSNWCTVTTSTTGVTLTILENTGSSRNAEVTVKNGSILVGTWTIEQAEEKYLWIISSGQTTVSTTDVTSAGTSLSYNILTNYSQSELDGFTATTPDWINTVKLTKSTSALTFNVDQNILSSGRSGDVLVGGLTVSITQNAGVEFNPNLKVNGSTTPENIGSAVTEFTITTEPNDTSVSYQILVDTTVVTTTSGNYSGSYTCGANTGTTERTFTVKCENESVIVTQEAKAYFEWSDTQTSAITETVGSASTSTSKSYTTNYTGLTVSSTTWISATISDGTVTANYDANPDLTTRTGYVYIMNGSTLVGTYTITQNEAESVTVTIPVSVNVTSQEQGGILNILGDNGSDAGNLYNYAGVLKNIGENIEIKLHKNTTTTAYTLSLTFDSTVSQARMEIGRSSTGYQANVNHLELNGISLDHEWEETGLVIEIVS